MAKQGSGLLHVGVGGALFTVAKVLELRGDMIPMSDSGGRLTFHVAALVVMLGAGAVFIRGGVVVMRRLLGKVSAQTPDLTEVFAGQRAEESDFDADAALARYMARKEAGDVPAPVTPPPGSFGRKRA